MSSSEEEPSAELKESLEACYRLYNRRRFVHPDPLEFLYRYEAKEDRELAALVASSLAYGRVEQILKSVSIVLNRMGPSPRAYLEEAGSEKILLDMSGFVHRFAGDRHIASLLSAAGKVIREHGSLENCFLSHFKACGKVFHPALCGFSGELRQRGSCGEPGHLVACPEKGSACKRMNLFLRWMVRRDEVDPGGWDGLSPGMLIIPLDTHMFRICRNIGFTRRRQADMKAALEITEAFRQFSPEDPVKYDFSLTRFGIRRDSELTSLELKDFLLTSSGQKVIR